MNDGVSVCITAYNSDKYIKECLDSVVSQTWFKNHTDWEIIVGVDGCEKTLNYLKTIMHNYKNLRVFMMDSNKGTYVTSNTIMSNSTYNNLFRFDSDDIMRPNLVETIMNKKNSYKYVLYYCKNFGSDTKSNIAAGTIYITKEMFLKYGGFRPWPCGADSELYYRLYYYEKIKTLHDILMDRRCHSESLTRSKKTCIGSDFRKPYQEIVNKMKHHPVKNPHIECEVNTYQEIFCDNINIEKQDEIISNIVEKITSKHLYSENKNVIYTCITGDYENLFNPSFINEEFDYICFTDNPDCVKGDIWEIREIPNELKSLSNVKQQRVIKICPHKYLSEYELSVWVDGSIDITGNINNLLTSIFENDKSVYIPKHPHRRCIYDEAIVCIKLKKDIIDNIDPQIYRYSKDSFPKYNGLVQTGIIIRKHNDNYCVNLMEMWKNELINGSHRDQLSFNYCLWKLGDNGFKYLDKTLFMSIYFKLYKHRERCEHLDTKNNVKQTINQTSKSKYIMVGNRLIRKK